MKQATEFESKYSKLVASEASPSVFNEAGEVVSVLFENRWVRILVIRTKASSDIAIEVETSLPRDIEGESDGLSSEELLEGAINHLYYLKALGSIGFTLDVIRQDCLWTASKSFTNGVETTVFQKLCPPECP